MTTNNAANKMISRVEGRELILERIFDAPRALVFKVFSEAEHLKSWFGPKSWPLSVCNIDFRPGGVWHFCMKCVDQSEESYGQEAWGKAVYREIVEPERIVYINSFSDAEGNIVEEMPESLVTLTFVELESRTKLITHTQFASVEDLNKVIGMGHLEGMEQTGDRLAEHLEEAKKI